MSVFIAQLFPKDKVKDIPGASQAGINFCLSFVEAVDPDIVYAYQLNSEGKKLHFDFDNPKIKYVVTRTFPHKSIFKALNTVLENFNIIGKVLRSGQKNIWFYNMTPQVMPVFSVLRFLFRKKCFVVMADFTPELFRSKIALKLLRRSSGIISLTPELNGLINNAAPFVVKAGIVNNVVKPNQRAGVNKTGFLFSGALSQYTGIDLALEAFAEMPGIDLYVSGRGERDDAVRVYAEKYPNIHFLGFLSYDEYVKALDKVDFVLSLRDTSLGKNLYNFPSKIIEYYIAGKVVISTKKYSTLADDTYVHCGYNKEELKNKVLEVTGFSDEVITAMQSKANDFARENFSYQSWKDAVLGLENGKK